MDIYGTIGPSCAQPEILRAMFQEGMTGMRLNASHITVQEAEPQIRMIQEAGDSCGVAAKILIDLQGPELRIGKIAALPLQKGQRVSFGHAGIPVPDLVMEALEPGMEILLDDGGIRLEMTSRNDAVVRVGGTLTSFKSIALPGADLYPPTMTAQDVMNIQDAVRLGVTGVMQPFVRNAEDLRIVRAALHGAGGDSIALFAKIENLAGVQNLETFFPMAQEIVIARGDLGNAVPLWELPRIQKDIARRCRAAGVPFMVVTQMLASMEHHATPTRAEVSDIYNAVCDGASSVMVTGETAVGEYPVEVIRYLSKVVHSNE